MSNNSNQKNCFSINSVTCVFRKLNNSLKLATLFTVRLQIAKIVRRFEMIFSRSESYIDSKMWSLLNFNLHEEEDRLMANYLSQNFNIEVNAVNGLEKIKLPPMVPGTNVSG